MYSLRSEIDAVRTTNLIHFLAIILVLMTTVSEWRRNTIAPI
jgi:hypothetical protein